ncbi:Putative phage terminase, small subunit, P27 family [uncultured Caudovirales phage]|uniref:Phage terminase, small subunit, P27 family n=1 Tax=uncultured Caudovirales phage TaxID=2100421 RepID=A0A6J5P7I7_9CAUD|nr:Putative phage terminase, small subunit, P27 family [uncultured Caudovirales phage]
MSNRLPPELHIIKGTTGERKSKALPKDVRNRVPQADWLDDPTKWNKAQFIKETADFLWEVYGIGSNQDKHILAALAVQMDIYVRCWHELQSADIVVSHNNGATVGPNPYFTASDRALSRAVVLMNELGLTPKGRLASKTQEGGKYAKLLSGP